MIAPAMDWPDAELEPEEEPPTESTPTPAPSRLRPIAAALGPALELAENRRSGRETPIGVPFRSYEEALGGGLWPGMHVLVANTGTGKTTFAVELGTHAAKSGVPVAFVGLELDEAQIALRFLGEHSNVRWSALYLGRYRVEELERARAAAAEVGKLPIYVMTGPPQGWPVSELRLLAAEMRKAHPTGPMLLVVDFLQLVGDDFDPTGRRKDLRERIGAAAYVARDVARTYGAAVVLVSSAARDKYALLASALDQAGLVTRTLPGGIDSVRTIAQPQTLVGLGKESGEIEFAADSLTVLVRWPTPLDNGETPFICAVPKLRYGPARWFALRFWHRFEELPVKDVSELPEVSRKRAREASDVADQDELVRRVVETVRKCPGLTSATQVADRTTGTRKALFAAIKLALRDGLVGQDGKRFVIAEEGTANEA